LAQLLDQCDQVISATAGGTFICRPCISTQRLLAEWQNNVFALFLAEDKIIQETVDLMRSWPHSGFSIDRVYPSPGDSAGLERLAATKIFH
jgi:hypothetical protein